MRGPLGHASAHVKAGRRSGITGCSGAGADSFVGGAGNNVAAGNYSGVLSGFSNDACDEGTGIGGGENNTINSGGSAYDETIAGGTSNAISAGIGSFIGGGQSNSMNAGNYSFIGAGYGNSINIGGDYSFLGGGNGNTLSGPAGTLIGGEANNLGGAAGFIGGGLGNTMSGQYSVLVGGTNNTVAGQRASLGGGFHNSASGGASTVPGGNSNSAGGYASFAAGNHANASRTGTFVWSDNSSSTSTTPTANNEFLARASGGVVFFSNSAMTTGVLLAAGSGTWSSLSDRAVKTNVTSIDDAGILNKVAAMPISEWSYTSEHGVRHVGPMAQDFYSAFRVGEDNKHITSIDEDGVALAAIQALNRKLAAKNAALAARLKSDENRLARLEARVAAMH